MGPLNNTHELTSDNLRRNTQMATTIAAALLVGCAVVVVGASFWADAGNTLWEETDRALSRMDGCWNPNI